MELQNGFNGIKRIITAEILQLVAGVISIVLAVLLVVLAGADPESPLAAGLALGVLAAGLISGIIALIGLILYYVGVGTAAKDSASFKLAMIYLLIGIVVTIAGVVVSSFSKLTWGATFKDAASIVNAVAELLALICVINGIHGFAEQKGDEKVKGMCKSFRLILLVIYLLVITASALAVIFQNLDTIAGTVASVMSTVASVLMVIQYFFYLALLSRAKRMLEAPSAAAPMAEQQE